MNLQVAHSVPCTESEGPFRRAALWVQGCTLACPGCCNPELFPAQGGSSRALSDILAELAEHRQRHGIEGLTLLGGEPSEQLPAVTALCVAARRLGLGVIVFTGRTEAELAAMPGGPALLVAVDTLIDGRFDASRREPADGRRFIGSSNQRLVHRSPRYADPSLWSGPGGVELQMSADGELSLHGAPVLARRLARALAGPRELHRSGGGPPSGAPARISD